MSCSLGSASQAFLCGQAGLHPPLHAHHHSSTGTPAAGNTRRVQLHVTCVAPPRDPAGISGSAAASEVKQIQVPASFSTRPAAPQPLPQLHLAEARRTRERSRNGWNGRQDAPSARLQQQQQEQAVQVAPTLPVPLKFIVNKGASFFVSGSRDSDSEGGSDFEDAAEGNPSARSANLVLESTQLASPDASTEQRGQNVTSQLYSAIAQFRNGGNSNSIAARDVRAFLDENAEVSSPSESAGAGDAAISSGSTSGDEGFSDGEASDDESESSIAEAAGTAGWSPYSPIRNLMGLWGGLRGHAKAVMIQEQKKDQLTQAGATSALADAPTEVDTEASSLSEEERLQDELMVELGKDTEEGEGQGVMASGPPAKANAWAIWALMTWRREKQQEKTMQAAATAAAARAGAPPAKAAAVTAEDAAEVVKTVKGTSTSCTTCGACKAFATASAAKTEDGGSAVVAHTAETMAPFLHLADLAELRTAAVLSRLCHLAYTIPVLNEDYLFTQHRMRVVMTSLRKDEVAAMHKAAALAATTCAAALPDSGTTALPFAATLRLPIPQYNVLPLEPEGVGGSDMSEEVERGGGVIIDQSYESTASALASATAAYTMQDSASAPTGPAPGAGIVALAESKAKETALREEKESSEDAKKKKKKSEGTCPCHWFVCDEVKSGTRHFIIQGSESLASWQANLTFDPVPFEDPRLGVMVHRGIYTAAKALYRDLLPLVRAHMAVQGRERARIQLGGHSLGGSLASLIGLMLHLRGEVAPHNMLPIYTFGAPSVMCGGDQLLQRLGLPADHVRQVVMHRDLVPRAFACEYPGHIAEVLKRVSGALRNHPCLLSQRLVYAPMGHMMVLQPDEQAAPFHPLLPPHPGLFHLRHPEHVSSPAQTEDAMSESWIKAKGELRAAQLALLNNPHPLEILADPSSYGAEGFISRDHDPRHYTFALAAQARKTVRDLRRRERKQRRIERWLPLLQQVPGEVPGTTIGLPQKALPAPPSPGAAVGRTGTQVMATDAQDGDALVVRVPIVTKGISKRTVERRRRVLVKIEKCWRDLEEEAREGLDLLTGVPGTDSAAAATSPWASQPASPWAAQPALPMGVASAVVAGQGGIGISPASGGPAVAALGPQPLSFPAGASSSGTAGGDVSIVGPTRGRSWWPSAGWLAFWRAGDKGGQSNQLLGLMFLVAAAASSSPVTIVDVMI